MVGTSTLNNTKSNDKDYHKPSTVEDMTLRNVETIVQLEEAAKASRRNFDDFTAKV